MNKSTIERYFAGTTTREEEHALLHYFSSEQVDPELIQYQKYFCGLENISAHSHTIIPEEEYEKFTYIHKNYSYYIKRYVIPFAAAASVALLLLFSPIFHKTGDFVLINGKKYTDKKHIELAFQTSLENVKLNAKQIFDDFDDDLFN